MTNSEDSPVPVLSPRGRPSDFFTGLWLPFRSLPLLFRSRTLLGLSLLSTLVTSVSLVGLVVLLTRHTGTLLGLLWSQPGSWYGNLLWHAVAVLTFAVLLLVGANTVPLLLLAPLQDPISEATETLCGNFQAPPFSFPRLLRGATVSLTHTGNRIGLLLIGHALLLALHLIPVAGSVAWAIVSAVWTMVWLSGEYLSGPMARHLLPFAQVRRALWKRKALTLGFGASLYVLLWIPVLNFFLIPLALVGGTLMFRALRSAGDV